MSFTELNTVEYHIIDKLTGVNLNATEVSDAKTHYGAEWMHKSSERRSRDA